MGDNVELSVSTLRQSPEYDLKQKFCTYDTEHETFLDPFSNFKLNLNYFSEKDFADFIKTQNGLLILSWNIAGLNAKFTQFEDFIDFLVSKKVFIDIVCLQESYYIDKPELYALEGYNLHFRNRSRCKRGGVAIFVRKELHCKELSNLSFFEENIFESLTLEVETSKGKKILVSSVYTPPYNNNLNLNLNLASFSETIFENWTNLQTQLDEKHWDSYICTDTNMDLLKFDRNEVCKEFLHLNLFNGFLPLITKPTRLSNSCATLIDNIFTNSSKIESQCGIITSTISDHFPCFHTLDLAKIKGKKKDFEFRAFNEENILRFRGLLGTRNWDEIIESENTETAFDEFLSEFSICFEEAFPVKKIRFNKNIHKGKDFMSKGLLISRLRKLELSKKRIEDPTPQNINEYNVYLNSYNSLIKAAKKLNTQRKLHENRKNMRETWNILRESTGKVIDKNSSIRELNVNGDIISNKKDIASKMNDFFTSVAQQITENINPSMKDPIENVPNLDSELVFSGVSQREIIKLVNSMESKRSTDVFGISNFLLKKVIDLVAFPLCHIFNLSIRSGIIPTKLKQAKVIPIYKMKGMPNAQDTLPTNYRPISLLPIFSKILEKIIAKQLTEYLNENDILFHHQYGFQAKKSTIHPMVHLLNHIGKAKNEKKVTIGVFCDISKGFDTISHSILIKKMEKIGIKNQALKWFKNYLEGRKQFVQVEGEVSELLDIRKGVPQGSILGPILFLIYINDLPIATELFTLLFADDTSFLISGKNLEDVTRKLNTELKKVCDWFRSNEMSLHPDKTKFMIFNKSEGSIPWNEINLELNFNNENEMNPNNIVKLKYVNSQSQVPAIKFLGIFIDPNLNFKFHIDYVHKKVSSSLYMINRAKNFLTEDALKILFNSFIQSHLLYCLPIYSCTNKTSLNKLFKIQKKAIRVITNSKYNAHTADKFRKLGILPLEQQITFSKLLFMYDYINGKLPKSFHLMWKKNNEVFVDNLRNTRRNNDNDFYEPLVRCKSIEILPCYSFQKLWNENCNNDLLTHNQSRYMFKKSLKTYLMINVETLCTRLNCNECNEN